MTAKGAGYGMVLAARSLPAEVVNCGDGSVPITVEVNRAIVHVDMGWRLVLTDFIDFDAVQFEPLGDGRATAFRAAPG